MASEYKLSYTASEIDEKLGVIDDALLCTEQILTEDQKMIARNNIGAVSSDEALNSAKTYTDEKFTNLVGETPVSEQISGAVEGLATESYINDKVGDIETALDAIIAIQNELIGGDSA